MKWNEFKFIEELPFIKFYCDDFLDLKINYFKKSWIVNNIIISVIGYRV
jgi:hypothetical protein